MPVYRRREEKIPKLSFPLGPGEGYYERKEVMVMTNKGKKEPKATTTKTECGCGCVPLKK